MESLNWYGYVVWMPVLSWIALFLWFYRYATPLYLKKMVRKGNKWAVLPDFAQKNKSFFPRTRLKCFVFSLLVAIHTACSVAWTMDALQYGDPLYGFASALVFLVLALVLYRAAVKKGTAIYQSAYFYEYRRVRYETERKGAFQNEVDVHNRTVWSFTRKLRNAETHRRLWKYVNAMAKTKKVPPDIYAETMY